MFRSEGPFERVHFARIAEFYAHASPEVQALMEESALVIIDFKRIPGESSAWLLDHVRAGKEEVIGELEDAGFEVVADLPILEENYFLRLRLRADAAP